MYGSNVRMETNKKAILSQNNSEKEKHDDYAKNAGVFGLLCANAFVL